jgi:hypothetical protein
LIILIILGEEYKLWSSRYAYRYLNFTFLLPLVILRFKMLFILVLNPVEALLTETSTWIVHETEQRK